MTAESSTTPADPRSLLNAAIEHAPKTILAGPLADLVVREMRNGLWWLDKTESIQTDSDLSEITFDVVYASKARQVLSLPEREAETAVPTVREVAEAMYAVDYSRPLDDAHPAIQKSLERRAHVAITLITGQEPA